VIEQSVDRRDSADRRISRFALRFPDRRLGFSRRRVAAGRARSSATRLFAAYRDTPLALAVVLATVIALNIADLLLTFRAIELGAVELNPIMAALINTDPLLAALFKTTIVVGVAAAMWATRRYRRVLEASLVLLAAFVVLTTYSGAMVLLAG